MGVACACSLPGCERLAGGPAGGRTRDRAGHCERADRAPDLHGSEAMWGRLASRAGHRTGGRSCSPGRRSGSSTPTGRAWTASSAGHPNPAFEASGTTISFIEHGRVTVDGIDTLRGSSPGVTAVTDAVWSATGELAVVRHGALWAGRTGRLRRIAPGTDPSWSPSGDRIAAVQHGWVVIVNLRGHGVRRLARGSAPAFSPDGQWVAFVAPDHRLMIAPREAAGLRGWWGTCGPRRSTGSHGRAARTPAVSRLRARRSSRARRPRW